MSNLGFEHGFLSSHSPRLGRDLGAHQIDPYHSQKKGPWGREGEATLLEESQVSYSLISFFLVSELEGRVGLGSGGGTG